MRRLFAMSLLAASALHAAPARYATVRFDGFATYPERLLVARAGIRREGQAVIADTDAIAAVLAAERYIAWHSITAEKGNLVISITERKSAWRLLVPGSPSSLAELDASLAVISSGTTYSDRPLLTALPADVRDGRLGGRAAELLRRLERSASGLSAFSQIAEIDLTDPFYVRIQFKGRKTLFTLAPARSSLIQVEALVGYFDASGRYPATARIEGASAVLGGF